MILIHQAISNIHQQLSTQYPETEISSFVRILFKHYLGLSPMEIHLQGDKEIYFRDADLIQKVVDELKKYRPIQYIIGETEFYGLKFRVTPDVLIPRPETEELVDWIVSEYKTFPMAYGGLCPRILDIGTGSGCIAVSLAANLPGSEVWAMDISSQALTVAEENAATNGVQLHTLCGDILAKNVSETFPDVYFDVIVSNPPYISLSEKPLMQANVLEYEPHLALFPVGKDPLIFYERIASFGLNHLNKPGHLFFEINETFLEETASILTQLQYNNIVTRKDINDKWRMITASRT